MVTYKLLRNSAICLCCNKEIVSKHSHDFVTCGCFNAMFVDGGNDYCRRGARDISKIKDTSMYDDERNTPPSFEVGDIVAEEWAHQHFLVLKNDGDLESDPITTFPLARYTLLLIKDNYVEAGKIVKYSEYAASKYLKKV